jgi:hypothetical protein
MSPRLLAPLAGLAVLVALAGVVRQSAPAGQPPDADRMIDVSLIRLIANPEAFDGKLVRVHGFVRVEHEGTSVYLHREDFERSLTKNGLWLQASDVAAPGSREAAVQNRYALIEGRFSAKETGHRGLWSGSIKDITRMIPWEFPERAK